MRSRSCGPHLSCLALTRAAGVAATAQSWELSLVEDRLVVLGPAGGQAVLPRAQQRALLLLLGLGGRLLLPRAGVLLLPQPRVLRLGLLRLPLLLGGPAHAKGVVGRGGQPGELLPRHVGPGACLAHHAEQVSRGVVAVGPQPSLPRTCPARGPLQPEAAPKASHAQARHVQAARAGQRPLAPGEGHPCALDAGGGPSLQGAAQDTVEPGDASAWPPLGQAAVQACAAWEGPSRGLPGQVAAQLRTKAAPPGVLSKLPHLQWDSKTAAQGAAGQLTYVNSADEQHQVWAKDIRDPSVAGVQHRVRSITCVGARPAHHMPGVGLHHHVRRAHMLHPAELRGPKSVLLRRLLSCRCWQASKHGPAERRSGEVRCSAGSPCLTEEWSRLCQVMLFNHNQSQPTCCRPALLACQSRLAADLAGCLQAIEAVSQKQPQWEARAHMRPAALQASTAS